MTGQETLLDYTPTQEEEIARLNGLLAKYTAELEVVTGSPILVEFKAVEKKAKKVAKEVESLGEKIAKTEKELRKLQAIKIEEPTENGFYILTTSSEYHKEISISEQLYIRVFGDWLEAENGGWFKNNRWRRTEDFSSWLGIDEDTLSATFIKIENLDEMPAELKEEPMQHFGRGAAVDDDGEDGEEVDE